MCGLFAYGEEARTMLVYTLGGSKQQVGNFLCNEGHPRWRNHAPRHKRKMGCAVYQIGKDSKQTKTTRPLPQHKMSLYFLRGKATTCPNSVRCADITHITMRWGLPYLAAIRLIMPSAALLALVELHALA